MVDKILVVDDEIEIALLCKDILECEFGEGIVDIARTKDEAITKINENKYIAVISDLRLGADSGIEVLEASSSKQRIKNEPTARIAITGRHYYDEFYSVVHKNDVVGFLKKGTTTFNEELLHVVKKRVFEYVRYEKEKNANKTSIELKGEEREFYIKNTPLLKKLQDAELSLDDVIIVKEGVERGIRQVHNKHWIVKSIRKQGGGIDNLAFVKKRVDYSKISTGITGKESKNLEERTHDEAFFMKYADKRWAPCPKLLKETCDELRMNYYPAPSDDLEINMLKNKIKNLEDLIVESSNPEEIEKLKIELNNYIKEKDSSIEMSDRSICNFSAVMSYWMGDTLPYGKEEDNIERKVFDVVLAKRINKETGRFDLEIYHKNRIKYSVIGLVLYNYFDRLSKVSTGGIPSGEENWSGKMMIDVAVNSQFINTYTLPKEDMDELERLTAPIVECYKNNHFLGGIQDDSGNSEHIGPAVDTDKVTGQMMKFKVIYDLDRCAIDKYFTDFLNHHADHINNTPLREEKGYERKQIEKMNERLEKWVVMRYNKMVDLHKEERAEFDMPFSELEPDYKEKVENISDISKEYTEELMMQKDLIMIEVLLHYPSLGAWNCLRNHQDYRDLIKRTPIRDFNLLENVPAVKEYKTNYRDIIHNDVILPAQSRMLNAWLDHLVDNKSPYYKFQDDLVQNLKDLKTYLNRGVHIKNTVTPVIKGGGYL